MSIIVLDMRTNDAAISPVEVLFGLARRRLLGLLLGRPDEEFHLRQLVREAGLSPGSAHRELGLLVSAGIIVRREAGRQVFFRANRESPVFPELARLLGRCSGSPAERPPDCVLKLLWDADRDQVDVRRHERYIVRRVLEHGDPESVRWLRGIYGDDAIRQAVSSGRGLSAMTARFWRELLDAGDGVAS